jgi:hypothetical protein
MLTLYELNQLLKENELLTVQAMRDQSPENAKRLFELTLHRSVIKDTIIEVYEHLTHDYKADKYEAKVS